MKLHLTTILLICFEHISKVIAQGMPISPCPKIFQYRFDGHEWFGLIAVRQLAPALHIRVTLSMRGKPTTNYLGEIELLTRGQFTQDAPVLYKIRFPKHNFPPKLILISANNQVICFGSGEHSVFMTQIQLEHMRKLTFLADQKATGTGKEMPAQTQQHIQFKKKPFHSSREICGKIESSLDFRGSQLTEPVFVDYLEGEEEVEEEDDEQVVVMDKELPSITRGSWPWLAAIYVNNLTSLDFQCGGTLVSSRVVISSAHCFRLFNHDYTANEVLVFLGRHNLKNWNEEGSLAAPVDGIYIHPDYNSQLSSYDADLAVIVLKEEVRFNRFIRPVCLWSGSSKTEYIVGEQGLVIGWSFDRSKNVTKASKASPLPAADSSIPKVLKAPIVTNEVCFKANAHFRSLSSNRTFCAGVKVEEAAKGSSSSSLYTGISGAGLMIHKNKRWMLRGTVSAALPSGPYLIYADVAKFIDWIMAFII